MLCCFRCASSPVYKTRMMAARALQPLAGKDQVTAILTTLLKNLPQKPQHSGQALSQSLIHGILLQVKSRLWNRCLNFDSLGKPRTSLICGVERSTSLKAVLQLKWRQSLWHGSCWTTGFYFLLHDVSFTTLCSGKTKQNGICLSFMLLRFLYQIYHLLLLTPDLGSTLLQKLTTVCAAGWFQHLWLITRYVQSSRSPRKCMSQTSAGNLPLVLDCLPEMGLSLEDHSLGSQRKQEIWKSVVLSTNLTKCTGQTSARSFPLALDNLPKLGLTTAVHSLHTQRKKKEFKIICFVNRLTESLTFSGHQRLSCHLKVRVWMSFCWFACAGPNSCD